MAMHKPSKYAGVIDRLQPLPSDDPYQDKIDALKVSLRDGVTHTPESLASLYAVARREKDDIEASLSPVNMRVATLEQMLVESHEVDDGWGMYGASPNTVRLASGASVSIQYEPIGKVEDKDLFRRWCVANGLENSLQLWPSTMLAIVKERLLNGQPEPDGVKAFVRTIVKLKKV